MAVASAEPYASYLLFAPEDNHASTSSVRFLRARCRSWHPTNSVKALKAILIHTWYLLDVLIIIMSAYVESSDVLTQTTKQVGKVWQTSQQSVTRFADP